MFMLSISSLKALLLVAMFLYGQYEDYMVQQQIEILMPEQTEISPENVNASERPAQFEIHFDDAIVFDEH